MGRILELGVQGDDVTRWQTFLIGRGLMIGAANGTFDERTKTATEGYQRTRHLMDDGEVGNMTLNAATSDGYPALPMADKSSQDERSQYFPPKPSNITFLTSERRNQLFGSIPYKAAPSLGNPEGIYIEGDWTAQHIISVDTPQLAAAGVRQGTVTGALVEHVRLSKVAKDPFLALLDDWAKADLLKLILTWDGGFYPRFKRGSTTDLSNHSWGTAFDINEEWNQLGSIPALVGQRGSVRKLVSVANARGFYWGGHYNSRLDGMHFELVKV
jgi:hypothetical protein